MTLGEAQRLVKSKKIEFFLCSFVEMTGVPKAKVVPATHLKDMAEGMAGFAGFATGGMGQGPHDTDMIAMPDFASLTHLPWRPNMAWVASDITVDGKSYPYCPRTILKGQLAAARKAGYRFFTGVEPEFMLLRRNDAGGYDLGDAKDNLARPCYDLRTLNRSLDVMTELLKTMQAIGWDPYANDHEDANAQFEINWTFSEALTTADRHVFFRWMVKTIAERHGLHATFMPKPFAHLTGNGCHFHMSLWDLGGKRNLFEGTKDPLGLSPLAYHFLGGIKKHARALAAVCSPTVNSYKRLIATAPDSGATWAPVYITHGASNRTQMIRVPGPGRLENRSADGACNPYLAHAVILAAGLDGIRNRIPAGKANSKNLYESSLADLKREGIQMLPRDLDEAVDALEADRVVMAALGETYGPYYVAEKRAEWRRYHNAVSDWERKAYLEVF